MGVWVEERGKRKREEEKGKRNNNKKVLNIKKQAQSIDEKGSTRGIENKG